MNIQKHIGKKLRELRTERHLSLERVAQLMGVTRMSMSRYETGKSTVSIDQLAQFAALFDKDITFFLPPSLQPRTPEQPPEKQSKK